MMTAKKLFQLPGNGGCRIESNRIIGECRQRTSAEAFVGTKRDWKGEQSLATSLYITLFGSRRLEVANKKQAILVATTKHDKPR